eukprot:m.23921 g.23921  ORF g.23921 m.23921 type:complete len:437 (-) comp4187_c0_seq1:270-1580(-)
MALVLRAEQVLLQMALLLAAGQQVRASTTAAPTTTTTTTTTTAIPDGGDDYTDTATEIAMLVLPFALAAAFVIASAALLWSLCRSGNVQPVASRSTHVHGTSSQSVCVIEPSRPRVLHIVPPPPILVTETLAPITTITTTVPAQRALEPAAAIVPAPSSRKARGGSRKKSIVSEDSVSSYSSQDSRGSNRIISGVIVDNLAYGMDRFYGFEPAFVEGGQLEEREFAPGEPVGRGLVQESLRRDAAYPTQFPWYSDRLYYEQPADEGDWVEAPALERGGDGRSYRPHTEFPSWLEPPEDSAALPYGVDMARGRSMEPFEPQDFPPTRTVSGYEDGPALYGQFRAPGGAEVSPDDLSDGSFENGPLPAGFADQRIQYEGPYSVEDVGPSATVSGYYEAAQRPRWPRSPAAHNSNTGSHASGDYMDGYQVPATDRETEV